MVPRRATFIIALAVVLSAAFAALATQEPLKADVQAKKVVTQDTGREIYLPADEALPKDIIEYRLTYSNTGGEVLRNITVTDPVPSGTEYISRTANRPNDGSVEFSIDGGKSYHPWPVRYRKTKPDGQELWVEATADMVTHIRWIVAKDFEPETEITFIYRAIVK